MNKFKKITALSLAAAMLCTVGAGPACEAKRAPADEESTVSELAVVSADGSLKSPISVLSDATLWPGEVIGDGVKLRASASTTGRVLELMYYGELVRVDLYKSKVGSGWYYLKRVKTGTKGYASTKYVVRY